MRKTIHISAAFAALALAGCHGYYDTGAQQFLIARGYTNPRVSTLKDPEDNICGDSVQAIAWTADGGKGGLICIKDGNFILMAH